MTWHIPPETVSLPCQEVHVWQFRLNVPQETVEKLAQRLSPSERQRAEQMRFEKDWRALVVSRGVLRGLLGIYLQRPPSSLEFHYNAYGKPSLSPALAQAIEFNVSHSGELALFAFAREASVGIDLEAIRPLEDLAGMVKSCLAPSEQERFGALPADERLSKFFRIWTRKEALSKAIGTGILDMCLDLDVLDRHWQVLDLDAGPAFAAALAIHGSDFVVRRCKGSADTI
jgi:4'-phosphopantetheinyl transferase